MPELPDLTVYLDALRKRILGRRLEGVRLQSAFVVRTVTQPVSLVGREVTDLHLIGKRIVFELTGERFMVVHLMIAGRFQWKDSGAPPKNRIVLATFTFPNGTLVLTEASPKKRASIHVVEGRDQLREFDRGGLDVMAADLSAFSTRLTSENHTLKRALTDPSLFSGIGNAYSDEILHAARLSPLTLTSRLKPDEIERLWCSVQSTLTQWTTRLRSAAGDVFPMKVTAFHPDMAVHGRYRQPCPVCSTPVQHIVYADNECNYCPTCQTGGRLLADRGMSRLLRSDWPKSLDEWDAHVEARRVTPPATSRSD
ncbi:MAG: formamidopyrimidine-DNA glycosylase [Acidimicrobiia bacterium]